MELLFLVVTFIIVYFVVYLLAKIKLPESVSVPPINTQKMQYWRTPEKKLCIGSNKVLSNNNAIQGNLPNEIKNSSRWHLQATVQIHEGGFYQMLNKITDKSLTFPILLVRPNVYVTAAFMKDKGNMKIYLSSPLGNQYKNADISSLPGTILGPGKHQIDVVKTGNNLDFIINESVVYSSIVGNLNESDILITPMSYGNLNIISILNFNLCA